MQFVNCKFIDSLFNIGGDVIVCYAIGIVHSSCTSHHITFSLH